MNEEKNSFVVFTDIKEILDELDDKQVAALFRGMVDYQETGKVPNFRGALKYIFIPIRQQMDRNSEKWSKTKTVRSEAGRKGGLKAAENRASKSKQNVANEANATFASSNEANQANQAVTVTGTVTVTDTVNVTVTDTVGEEMSPESLSLSLVDYLNEKSGASYKNDAGTVQLVTGLIGMGYTEADIRSVIDKKCSDWLPDPKMRQYLRPSTLFGNKFGQYLSAPEPPQDEQKQKRHDTREKLIQDKDELNARLIRVRTQIATEDDPVRSGDLAEEEAILLDRIDVIGRRLEAMT